MELTINQILVPCLPSPIISGPHRILDIDESRDVVWCIALRQTDTNGRLPGYVAGAQTISLSAINTALSQDELRVEPFTPPGHWLMTDADYLAETTDEREQALRKSRIKKRDELWSMIHPIVDQPKAYRSDHGSLRPLIVRQAEVHHASLPRLYRALHLFWANGSIVNGLLPATHRCGGRGKHRAHYACRERQAPEVGTHTSRGFYSLSELDRERLARGFALISPERPARTAYQETCGAFWSRTTTDEDGVIQVELLPPQERPTFAQFRYWGEKLSDKSARMRRLGLRFRNTSTHHGGAAQDLTVAIGQVGMFDATSTDVYLTSMRSRLIKLPPLTRSLVMEVRSTACMGLYCGWDHPSPGTGLRAIYCAATDKADLCKRFGIAIGPDDWPGMLCRTYLADNGELKAKVTTEAERQIGFGIEFARAYSGSSKSTVETQHHTDHRKLDHRIPGTTHGKQHERGMPQPIDAALWNYWEYMRELLLWILEYNNQEIPKLAPTEMLIAGIRPTRINIFKWLRDHGQRADIQCDLDQLRALTLPEWPAVVQYNGVIVKTPDGKRNVAGPRYFCDALRDDPRFQHANSQRDVVPVSVRFEGENLAELWLPTSRGLLRVPNVASDSKARREDTLADIEQRYIEDTPARKQREATEDQKGLDTALRRDAVTTAAKRELESELRKCEVKISKSAQRKGLRANAAQEQKDIDQLARGQQPGVPASAPSKAPPEHLATSDAAFAAVTAFMATLQADGRDGG